MRATMSPDVESILSEKSLQKHLKFMTAQFSKRHISSDAINYYVQNSLIKMKVQ